MPRDPEVDKLLYGDAGPPGTSKGGGAKPSAGPSDDQLDWQQRAGKGVAKSLAATATGIPRAINAGIGLVAPETS